MMGHSTKRIYAVFLVTVLMLCLVSCGEDKDVWAGEYNPKTDFKLNVEYPSGVGMMTETENGYYFINGLYLYYINKDTLECTPLCSKANCLHDRETDISKKAECGACVQANGIFSYKQDIYLVRQGENCVNVDRFSNKGEYIKTICELPYDTYIVLLHRGYIFYTYSDLDGYIEPGKTYINMPSGQFYIMKVSLDGGKEEVIYKCPLDGNGFVNVNLETAYKNMLYATEQGTEINSSEMVLRGIAINLETNEYTYQEAEEYTPGTKTIYNNKIVYNRWYYDYFDKRNRTAYSMDLDLANENPIFESEYDTPLLFWDGEYWYDTNWSVFTLAKGADYQEFTVYDDNRNKLCSFDFRNVEGHDFSRENFHDPVITEEYMFFRTQRDETGVYIICIDKKDFEEGIVEPRIVFELPIEFTSNEIYNDN